MKQKDTIYLIITIVIVALIGLLLYAHFGSKGKDKGVTTVEVIAPIASGFDQGSLATLANPSKVINFQPNISLDGLGNAQPFGPLH